MREAGQMSRGRLLAALFWEFFKIALFVVGGGYAIIAVADNVFGRRLKWLGEGEILDHLPVFQMIPGIIAGNTAVYTGLKLAGRLGAVVSLLGVALPSVAIFTAISCGYGSLPVDNRLLSAAFLGLRSSLVGIIAATIAAGWRKNVRGVYGYSALALGIAALALGAGTLPLLVAALAAGAVLEYCGLGDAGSVMSAGVQLAPLGARGRLRVALATAFVLVAATLLCGPLFWIFAKFGLMCFGGGFVLVPAYIDQFVGPDAPMLRLPMDEFANLMALTQATPGPVAANSATFFGFRMAGIVGALVATAGLFMPSLFLLTAALTGLERWKNNRLVRGMMRGVRPATVALMISACASFAALSLWSRDDAGVAFSMRAIALAAFACAATLSRRLQPMTVIFTCAAAAAAAASMGF